ncbi:MAG: sugar phosphate isomerase/epimerase family protein [Puniceicoccaceae bacterium]
MKTVKELNWSFSSLGCPELNLEEIVRLAKQYGIGGLELRTVEDRVDMPALFSERFGSPENLNDWLVEASMRIQALDSSLKLVGNSAEDRDAFLEFVEWAEALDVPSLRVFDGGTYDASTLSDEDLAQALETINWWRSLRQKHGWNSDIIIETHDCLTATPAIQQLQSHLDDPQMILWDTHHTWKKGGEDPRETWQAIRQWVNHVHVKDSVSKPSARHPFSYIMLGEGEFDLGGTLSMFAESGYEGIVSLEWERKWHPYLEPLSDALAKAREFGWL